MMPATYRINIPDQIILTEAEGILTGEEIKNHHTMLFNDPEFNAAYRQLIDLRGVTEFAVSSDEMRNISEYEKIFTDRSHRAIVASTNVVFGMARMYELLHSESPEEVMVFKNMTDAKQWLGLVE